jgi:hypothetical protein
MFYDLPELIYRSIWLSEMLNHRWIEHFVEFQLIQVMNMKMLLLQFESIVNLIQMKLMKVIHNLRNSLIQEFQYPMKFEDLIMMKNYESIGD